MKKQTITVWLAVVLVVSCCLQPQAANLIWSDPMTISNPGDVSTLWSLDRAYNLGSANSISVNGVTFLPINAPTLEERIPLPESIRQDTTEIVISSDGDGLFAKKMDFSKAAMMLTPNYQMLLESGLSDSGSACALHLGGLKPGRIYLLQVWINDSRSSSETLVGGGIPSPRVRFASTTTSGGAGQYIIGVFTADDEQQSITIMPDDNGSPLINAFQLRIAPENAGPAIVTEPLSTANYAGKTVKLSGWAAGRQNMSYQWQKVEAGKTRNLFDNDKLMGSATSALVIHSLAPDDAGDYRVLVRDETGTASSATARVSMLRAPTEQLINVDINNGSSATYKGDGVLIQNSGFDVWNGINGRNGFTNVALVDSTGAETRARLTLTKPREDGFTREDIQNELLKDYSPASIQTVTLNNLEPDSYYNLVVYSIGRAPNEGGVFSGALEGIVHGYMESDYRVSRFSLGTNYIQNPFAKSDADGVLRFTIKAISTVSKDGFYNGDFNGLQILKVATNGMVPAILQQPESVAAYPNQPVVLKASAVGLPSSKLTYLWQKTSATGRNTLADGNGIGGSTSPGLVISNLTSFSAGDYQVVIGGMQGSVTSRVATVSMLPSPRLINVDIKNETVPVYDGRGVLTGLGGNYWNGINGRTSFTDRALLDNEGKPTMVTISLQKEQVDSYTSRVTENNLLKDYSVGHPQTVILKSLAPNSRYRLLVYSFGAMEHEGGVFSGAIKGIVYGWHGSPAGVANNFVQGTNYIENASAQTDAHGTLSFTIEPTSKAVPNGFYNCDFNGLQIMRIE